MEVGMKRMTPEEGKALDELLTKTDPEFTNIPGIFAQQKFLLDSLDTITAKYIKSKAEYTHQTPAQVIGSIVHKEIAACA
jgi:hypothetical protein